MTRTTGRRPAAQAATAKRTTAKAPAKTTVAKRTPATKAGLVAKAPARKPVAKTATKPAAKAPARRTSSPSTAVASAPTAKLMTNDKYNSGIAPGRMYWGVASDFTNCKLDLKFLIGDDGLPTRISVHRVRGSNYLNPDPKNVSNMATDDSATYATIAARLGAAIMISSPAKRLTPGSSYRAIFNMGYSKVNDRATCSLKELYIIGNTKGTKRALLLEKSDVRYRRIRRATAFIPGAMVNSVNPF